MDAITNFLHQTLLRIEAIVERAESSKNDEALYDTILSRAAVAETLFDNATEAFNKALAEFDVENQPHADMATNMSKIDEAFFKIDGLRLKILRLRSASDTQAANSSIAPTPSPMHSSSSNVKLPRVNIPVFSGSRKDWPTFYDLFRTLVHEKEDISPIERFQYLRMYLTGEPLALINGIKFLGDNYEIAYKTLVDRYEDKRLLATNYWQALCNAPKVNPESPSSLRDLLNLFIENTTSLKQFTIDMWDFTIVNWILQKLNFGTRQRFEIEYSKSEIPTFKDLEGFISKQCKAIETSTIVGEKPPNRTKNYSTYKKPVSLVVSSSSEMCPLCTNDRHPLYRCKVFAGKSPADRYNFVKQHRLCLSCLHSSHTLRECSSKFRCKTCQSPHHSLLHFANGRPPQPQVSSSPGNAATSAASQPKEDPSPAVTGLSSFVSTTVLLASAKIWVFDYHNTPHVVRVLLDSGSQSSFMSEVCRKRLNLQKSPTNVVVNGLGLTSSKASSALSCNIAPRDSNDVIKLELLVIPKICEEMPSTLLPRNGWTHTQNLKLADPEFYLPRRIDMLIGADLFPSILMSGRKIGAPGEPIALETRFGWVLSGKIDYKLSSSVNTLFASAESDPNLDIAIRRFWEIEQVPIQIPPSKEDQKCEANFMNTYHRIESGRFVVSLPFKGIEPLFVDSREIALRRFLSLERRLIRNKNLQEQYCAFMKDYLDSGHMRLVPAGDVNVHKGPQQLYYIPHHCVLRPDSLTTKLRTVFDASASDSNGHSLNDSLFVGAKLQQDIMVLLSQFRVHSVVLTADLKQMYRQILVNPEHFKYQRILWRFDPSQPIEDYELLTVTYGLNSSPFLALRTLLEIAKLAKDQYPLVEKILSTNIYVDDLVTGCASIDEAQQLIEEINLVMNSCGFEFRKWASNEPAALRNLPQDQLQTPVDFDAESHLVVKILGLQWLPKEDVFSYKVAPLDRECTKRTMLSELARIFDPLGFLAPLTFLAKRLVQKLWCAKLDWDDAPPEDILDTWQKYKEQLRKLSSLRIQRRLSAHRAISHLEIHGFCDASESGYAAVIYLRSSISEKDISTSLICAKSKVAPLKRLSIPRLELCGAVLLADLIAFVVSTFSNVLEISSITAWTDSTIVLSWLNDSPHRWQTFVANRVSHIQDIVPANRWRHIQSMDNPADCASRGMLPHDLIGFPLWWNGPSWLSSPETEWPALEVTIIRTNEEEKRTTLLVTPPEKNNLLTLLERYSSLDKVLRIVSYCNRFIQKSRGSAGNSNNPRRDYFTAQELQQSQLQLARLVQQESFAEVKSFLLKRTPSLSKVIRKLNPFLHTDGLIRVGGRLSHSTLLNFDEKHPILLPSDSLLTIRIIESMHKDNLHPGVNTLHSLTRQKFWILSAKRIIAQCLQKCIRCFRLKPPVVEPFMGNLPQFRISQLKPFAHVGVDFGGPFSVTLGKHRGAKSYKAYVCLFVCMATKAIHVELASDLSAEAFLAALRRFIARRGRCNDISSDNGTNFVGARNLLLESMCVAAAEEKIAWHFNPPSAPHFGGIWEAGIKSIKTHLHRVIGDQTLTYEELNTVLIQIEALLNSRPLCALSSDPHDLTALTPGHFLTLEPLTTIPDEDFSKTPLNRLTRWQLLIRLHRDFWNRWKSEYLHTLQQRQKWNQPNVATPLEVGTLVVIRDDRLPPLKWHLGRVELLHKGADDVCRVVTLRTAQGSLQRPVVKVSPLPNQ